VYSLVCFLNGGRGMHNKIRGEAIKIHVINCFTGNSDFESPMAQLVLPHVMNPT